MRAERVIALIIHVLKYLLLLEGLNVSMLHIMYFTLLIESP